MRRSSILGLMLLLVPLGCPDDGGGGPIEYDGLVEAQADAICDFFVRCGFATSAELCVGAFGSLTSFPADLDAAIDNGTVQYDSSAASACLEALSGAACEDFLEAFDVEVCDRVFVGTIADGEACFIDEQCISGQCGSTGPCMMACCEGTCVAPPPEAALGESCAEADCVDGAYCDESELCVADRTQGEACPGSFECASGLSCIEGVCDLAPGEGEPCAGFQCAVPFACDVDTTTCVRMRGEGEACNPDFSICSIGLTCNSESSTCTRPGGPGTPCDVAIFGSSCDSSTYCDYDIELQQGTCQSLIADGGACVDGDTCRSGYCGTDQTCQPEPVCVQ